MLKDYEQRFECIASNYHVYEWHHNVDHKGGTTEVRVRGVLVARGQHEIPNLHWRVYKIEEPMCMRGLYQQVWMVKLGALDTERWPIFGEQIFSGSPLEKDTKIIARDMNEVIRRKIKSGELASD